EEGLRLLEWLVGGETRGGHFSFTPVGGWAPGEPRPGFDQQPIEAAAMAGGRAGAVDATGEPIWADPVPPARAWFPGAKAVRGAVLEGGTGGCKDGLERDGVNENEGAESTIALIGALQQVRRVQAAARRASISVEASTSAAPTQRSAAPYVR